MSSRRRVLDAIDDEDDVRGRIQNVPEQEQEQEEQQVTEVVPAPDNQPTPLEKFMAICKSLLLRAMVLYFVMTFIRSGGNKSSTPTTTTNQMSSENAFPNGTIINMYVQISSSPNIKTNEKFLWTQEGLVYGSWLDVVSPPLLFTLDEGMRDNGSIYIHAVLTPMGMGLESKEAVRVSKLLNKWKRLKVEEKRNLLSGGELADKNFNKPITSHYHPNLTINLVTDWTLWTEGAVPAPLHEHVQFIEDRKYLPVLFYNDYWNLAKDYLPVTRENLTLPLRLTIQPLSLFKWQLYAAQSVRPQWSALLSTEEQESDDTLKEAMIDTNPYLLGATFIVSILHSVFEFLAFKNDIQFWNNRQSLEGLSVRSVFFNVFQSLIVLLYVLDNETNFVIKVSCFVGLAIEIWKINKATDITTSQTFPFLKISDKQTYTKTATKTYDELAFRYLSWLCFPLLVLYAIYSLIYLEHKSLYSFILSLLYGFLLTFGFIMMTPQLFINYKLKSVAHLPWRMLSYKFLNTFIDDIFAFVIKMPWLYRVGCLRDDVVFFVYLYQRWAYRVDYKRVNEYGYVKKEEVDQVDALEVKKSE